MPKEIVRMGILGVGRIAQLVHIPNLMKMGGVEITAVAEPLEKHKEVARKLVPNALIFPDYKDLLEDAKLDAVLIALPPVLHAPAAVMAFDAGLQVYVEKPLATSLEDALLIQEAWKKAGTVGMVGFNFRFAPWVDRVIRMVHAHVIGNCNLVRTTGGIEKRSDLGWRAEPESGGVLFDVGSHHVDMLPYLYGSPVVKVFSTQHQIWDPGDLATLHMTMQNGVEVQSVFSFATHTADQYEFIGDRARLFVDRYKKDISLGYSPKSTGLLTRFWDGFWEMLQVMRVALRNRDETSYKLALEEFIRAIRTDSTPAGALISEGVAVQRILEAARESALSGEPVSIEPEEVRQPVLAVQKREPLLSVFMMKNGPYSLMARSLTALSNQTIADQIEVVFHVSRNAGYDDIDSELLEKFAAYKVVTSVYPNGHNLAIPLAYMTADFVGFYEDHAFATPDWAEAQVEAIHAGYAGSCPRFYNANPKSFVSEMTHSITYGEFTDSQEFGDTFDISLHNGIYSRAVLNTLGDKLEQLYQTNGGLNNVLREKGERLGRTEKGAIYHVSPSKIRPAVTIIFTMGRLYAGKKVLRTRMSFTKRVVNAAGCVIVPFVRFAEKYREYFTGGRNRKRRLRKMLAFFCALVINSFGRFWGYLFGMGFGEEFMAKVEDNRLVLANRSEQSIFDAVPGEVIGESQV